MPVRVAVLIDLHWSPEAGGHVKCWERFAHAATAFPETVDLSVYCLGTERQAIPLSSTVRIVTLPPRLGTERLPFLGRTPDHTDLAPGHPGLARDLPSFDVLHATDIFAFGRTALRHSRRTQTPLVSSLHTDVVQFTRIYGTEILGGLARVPFARRLITDGLRIPHRTAAAMQRRLDRFLLSSSHVLASSQPDYERLRSLLPPARLSYLRRGIDRDQFHPRHADRPWLEQQFRIHPGRRVILFVGRIDDSKGALLLAQAARVLLDRAENIHLILCGRGSRQQEIQDLLGPNATLAGHQPQSHLPRIYASADLFVFPSCTDLAPNVVLEAKASGLPVLVWSEDGAAQFVDRDGVDGCVLRTRDAGDWADRIAALLGNPGQMAAMGDCARHWIETKRPSWQDVLREDLLPVWLGVTRIDGNPVVAGSS